MALNKTILKNAFKAAFNDPKTFKNIDTVADAMASAIHVYITEGDVTGVCPSGGGALGNGKVI